MSGLSRVSVPALRIASSRSASSHASDNMAAWRTINKLASEGKWDNVNNSPKMFLFGATKKETYAAYNAINHNSDIWSQSPYGQYFKAVWRVLLLLGIIKAGVVTYEFVVPEEKRLHYKYRAKHGEHH